MKFALKDKIIFFILIICLNIILRLPVVSNEIGWDSFVVHSVANSLSTTHSAIWWLNPLSVIGSYPYSIGSVVPFLLSGITQLSNVSSDKTVLLYGFLISFISIFLVYSAVYEFFNDELIAIIASFCFTISPAILSFSTWTSSTRTLFILVIMPFVFYLLFKTSLGKKYIALFVTILAVAFATHHYTFLLLPIFISFICLKLLVQINPKFYLKVQNFNIIYIAVLILLFLIPFFTGIFMSSERGYMGSRYAFVLTIVLSLVRYTGFLLLFAIGGFFHTALKKNKQWKEWFLLASIAVITPLMYIETYMKWFSQFFIFILVGISLKNIIQTKHTKFILCIILISVTISGYLQYIHNSDDVDRYLDQKSYSSGTWISNNVEGNLAGTSKYPTLRIMAISNKPTLTISNMLNYMNGFIKYDESQIVKKNDKFSFNYYSDGPYDIDATDGEWFVGALPEWKMNDKHYIEFKNIFNVSYFISDLYETNTFSNSLLGNQVNKIYSNGRIELWDL